MEGAPKEKKIDSEKEKKEGIHDLDFYERMARDPVWEMESQKDTEVALERVTEILGHEKGIVEIKDKNVPTIVISDLHARRDFLLEIFKKDTGSEKTVFDLVKEGKINIVCLGDGMHSEKNSNWITEELRDMDTQLRAMPKDDPEKPKLQKEFDDIYAKLIEKEMAESFGTMRMIMELKSQFPDNFHYIRGNHDDIMNHAAKFNIIEQSAWTRWWMETKYGKDFLEKYKAFEEKMPLLIKGDNFVLSHAAPNRVFTQKEIEDRDLEVSGTTHGRAGKGNTGLTWTDNTKDGTSQEAIDGTLKNLGMPDDTVWMIGHRETDGKFRSQFGGKLIQICRPKEKIVAVFEPGKKIIPEENIYNIADPNVSIAELENIKEISKNPEEKAEQVAKEEFERLYGRFRDAINPALFPEDKFGKERHKEVSEGYRDLQELYRYPLGERELFKSWGEKLKVLKDCQEHVDRFVSWRKELEEKNEEGVEKEKKPSPEEVADRVDAELREELKTEMTKEGNKKTIENSEAGKEEKMLSEKEKESVIEKPKVITEKENKEKEFAPEEQEEFGYLLDEAEDFWRQLDAKMTEATNWEGYDEDDRKNLLVAETTRTMKGLVKKESDIFRGREKEIVQKIIEQLLKQK